MNLFKGLLFLEGHIVDPQLFDDAFAPHYGNQRASDRAFRDAFASTQFARAPLPHDGSPTGCG